MLADFCTLKMEAIFSPKRWFLQDSHYATSQKTKFFKVPLCLRLIYPSKLKHTVQVLLHHLWFTHSLLRLRFTVKVSPYLSFYVKSFTMSWRVTFRLIAEQQSLPF
jgi:hypothetical protein